MGSQSRRLIVLCGSPGEWQSSAIEAFRQRSWTIINEAESGGKPLQQICAAALKEGKEIAIQDRSSNQQERVPWLLVSSIFRVRAVALSWERGLQLPSQTQTAAQADLQELDFISLVDDAPESSTADTAPKPEAQMDYEPPSMNEGFRDVFRAASEAELLDFIDRIGPAAQPDPRGGAQGVAPLSSQPQLAPQGNSREQRKRRREQQREAKRLGLPFQSAAAGSSQAGSALRTWQEIWDESVRAAAAAAPQTHLQASQGPSGFPASTASTSLPSSSNQQLPSGFPGSCMGFLPGPAEKDVQPAPGGGRKGKRRRSGTTVGQMTKPTVPYDEVVLELGRDGVLTAVDDRPILLFDLNGTLTHHRERRQRSTRDSIMRPGVHHLRRLQRCFRLGLYSSATDATVFGVLSKLEKAAGIGPKLFPDEHLVLHRGHTQIAPEQHISDGGNDWDTIKPLSQYFAKLHRLLLIDDDSYKAIPEERENMVLVPCWDESPTDDCLRVLVETILETLADMNGHTDLRLFSQQISEKVFKECGLAPARVPQAAVYDQPPVNGALQLLPEAISAVVISAPAREPEAAVVDDPPAPDVNREEIFIPLDVD